ncbi:MAG: hypothetical protein ARM1_0537 [Candidatus Micrarchaeota archaeon]|nr:MAG: hypothetical protein ARM1_0537 [Candidatus Micrarchaeota archaeon]
MILVMFGEKMPDKTVLNMNGVDLSKDPKATS